MTEAELMAAGKAQRINGELRCSKCGDTLRGRGPLMSGGFDWWEHERTPSQGLCPKDHLVERSEYVRVLQAEIDRLRGALVEARRWCMAGGLADIDAALGVTE